MSRAFLKAASVMCALIATSALASELPDPEAFVDLPVSERRKIVSSLSREELAAVLAKIPAATLLEMGERRITQLGTYRARITKEERVDGEWTKPQTMDVVVQPAPHAIRAEVVKGPATGRRMLYNEKLRKREFRVKEPGILGAIGAVWIDVDSKLTRRDSRHPITNLGYAPAMRLLLTDFEKAKPTGGFQRTDEGFEADGSFCMSFDAPKEAKNMYGRKARLCISPEDALMTRIEVWDEVGRLERLHFELVETRMSLPPKHFTPEAAGL